MLRITREPGELEIDQAENDLRAADAPPETTMIRLGKLATSCLAPQYAAEELLRAEGFADIRYVTVGPGISS